MSAAARQVWAYVGALAAVVIFMVLYGIPIRPFSWWRSVSGAVLVTVVAFALWDNLLWKIPIVMQWTGRINVNGTWKGRLSSQFHTNTQAAPGADCQVKRADIDVYLVIRQRFSSIRIHQFTSTSSGEGQVSDYHRNGSGRSEAIMVYRNDPHEAGVLQAHRGTVHYIFERAGKRIAAEYWTNRFSRGLITFDEKHGAHADTFPAAQQLFD